MASNTYAASGAYKHSYERRRKARQEEENRRPASRNQESWLPRWDRPSAPGRKLADRGRKPRARQPAESEEDETESDDDGAGTPQHGLSSKTMALIASDEGVMRSLSIKWP